MAYPKKSLQPYKKKVEHNINENIQHSKVRITGEGIESKVVFIQEALDLVKELGLDLVEISPNSNPPVCRVCDYQKFLYEKKKREKENKQDQGSLKELQFSPNTSEHDVAYRVKNAIEWLKDGHKIKCTVLFKGRNIVYKEKGEVLLLKFAQSLEEIGKVENLPKLEGNKMFMLISPKKK